MTAFASWRPSPLPRCCERTYRRFISASWWKSGRSATQPAGRPPASARMRRPRGGAYSPGRLASSASKSWKHRLTPRPRWYSRKSSRQASMSPAVTASRNSVPEVFVLERDIGDGGAHQLDRRLQVVLLVAGNAHHVALDGSGDLELRVLDGLHDALGEVRLDAVAHLDLLLHLVAADLLAVLEREEARVHAPLGHLAEEDVLHLPQLELVVGECGDLVLLLLELEARVGALEVEAVGDLLVGRVHGVLELDRVGLAGDVEGGHVKFSVYVRDKSTLATILKS